MKLSQIERLMLANQFKILEKLYPDKAEMYARYCDALEDGYTREYSDLVGHLSRELSEDECNEVWDIFDMYRAIQSSYRQLSDKGDISEEDVRFEGFDGNDRVGEGPLMSYALYIVKDGRSYRDVQRSEGMNSHIRKLDHYRAMFKEWEDAGKSVSLTLERMKRILFPERPPQG